jgi:hypothetical protein
MSGRGLSVRHRGTQSCRFERTNRNGAAFRHKFEMPITIFGRLTTAHNFNKITTIGRFFQFNRGRENCRETRLYSHLFLQGYRLAAEISSLTRSDEAVR